MVDSKIAIKQLKALERLIPVEEKDMRLAADWDEEWKVLISTILSSQTKDETTIDVSNILYDKYPTPEKLAKGLLQDIEKIIRPVNYYRTKAKHIKESAKIISKSGIPGDVDGLLELPGVGRKVANVYLAAAFQAAAIGVDTHVSRLSVKLGWTKARFEQKHKIEKDLEILFPKRYWNSINYIMVRFGRTIGKNRKKEDELLEDVKKLASQKDL